MNQSPAVVASLRSYTGCPLDVHIMVADPAYYIERFAEAGADSITFHAEAADRPADLVRRLRQLGLGAGVTLKPGTGADALAEVIESVDMVLVMTVEPGYGGQEFIEGMLEKIKTIRCMLRPEQRLEVDGGIDHDTAARCAAAGADVSEPPEVPQFRGAVPARVVADEGPEDFLVLTRDVAFESDSEGNFFPWSGRLET